MKTFFCLKMEGKEGNEELTESNRKRKKYDKRDLI